MNPHIHISAMEGVKVALYVTIFLGIVHVVARRYEGHPAADAALNFLA